MTSCARSGDCITPGSTWSRVDGDDYRHRGLPEPVTPAASGVVVDAAEAGGSARRCRSASTVSRSSSAHLAAGAPTSQYRPLVADLDALPSTDTRPFVDQAEALRCWVVPRSIRLCDRDVPVVPYRVPEWIQLFTPEMLRRRVPQKYYRTISRLIALTRERRRGTAWNRVQRDAYRPERRIERSWGRRAPAASGRCPGASRTGFMVPGRRGGHRRRAATAFRLPHDPEFELPRRAPAIRPAMRGPDTPGPGVGELAQPERTSRVVPRVGP